MQIAIWIAVMVALVILAGRAGLFKGRAPKNLGLRDGKFKPPSKTPNSVSSQTHHWPHHPQQRHSHIQPLDLGDDGAVAMNRLVEVVGEIKGAHIVERSPDYLYVQFTTPVMRFVDDAEFWFDAESNLVQVRSASRIGRKDMHVNRARVEAIRARLSNA